MPYTLRESSNFPELPRGRFSWQFSFPMELNNNWDEIGFEIDRVTNVLSFLNSLNQSIVIFYEQPKRKIQDDDFNWFVSSNLDLSSYRGKYIAIYDKKIIGSGDTSGEALKIAKSINPQSEPALTFIPESDDVIFWVYPLNSEYDSLAVAA